MRKLCTALNVKKIIAWQLKLMDKGYIDAIYKFNQKHLKYQSKLEVLK
ncbi:Uncharacterized protein dnl_55690 [Desulfonema limicola]|uniref:Uncharacterized protein n=1 Tax=Desulfonema limicola TaxID=45656 RepID=A0A975GJP0_9BACT|nr:Uncharacterized protein dnl_55690 [Desulfonema limicola]